MFGHFSLNKAILGAVVALAMTAGPTLAAPHGGGRSGGGGYHSGGGGSYHGGGYSGYRGGYSGYRGGYSGYRGGYGGYGGYGLGYLGLGLGVGAYSYNNYNYGAYPYYDNYTPPVVYSSPTYVVTTPPSYTSDYYAPAATDDTARIEVMVPSPDAQVIFDGTLTQQTGTDRQFVSPPLTPGQPYHYTIEARWSEGGRMVKQTRMVTVTAGQAATANFNP